VSEAIQAVLSVTSEKGATLERIINETGLSSDQLVLPMALLMKTEKLHFKRTGMHDVYVSKGKAPEKPVIPPPTPPPAPAPVVAPPEPAAPSSTPVTEAAPPQQPAQAPPEPQAPVAQPKEEPKQQTAPAEPPRKKPEPKSEPAPRRERRMDEELEPTASVLMFGRRPKKEKKKRKR